MGNGGVYRKIGLVNCFLLETPPASLQNRESRNTAKGRGLLSSFAQTSSRIPHQLRSWQALSLGWPLVVFEIGSSRGQSALLKLLYSQKNSARLPPTDRLQFS